MMFHPLAKPFSIHVMQLAPFSADGRLYRAFGHLIAAQHGAVLCAPLHLMRGDLLPGRARTTLRARTQKRSVGA